MRLWALSDPHLTLATPHKAMHVFGEVWRDHEARIRTAWEAKVHPDDVVLVPGDISWASRLEDALTDLEFLHRLPGTKVLLEGNHERWWESVHQVRRALPPSLRAISGDHLEIGRWLVFGTRLWESRSIDCDELVAWNRLSDKRPDTRTPEQDQRNEAIFQRELGRLERCIGALPRRPWLRKVCMTHYPPVGSALAATPASERISRSGADLCVFGHLHSLVRRNLPGEPGLMGVVDGVDYRLASCDYLGMEPLLLDG